MQPASTTIIPGPTFARSLFYATAVLAFFTFAFGALTLKAEEGERPSETAAARF